MEKIRWRDIYQCECAEAAVQLFSDKLTRILDQLDPVKTVQTRIRYAPWLSQPTKLLIEERDQPQSRASRSKLEEDWKLYKRLRNQVTSKLRVEKSNWQQENLRKSSGNPRGPMEVCARLAGLENCKIPFPTISWWQDDQQTFSNCRLPE